MDIKLCDRCGKKITQGIVRMVVTNPKIIQLFYPLSKIFANFGTSEKLLCMDCAREFEVWLHNPTVANTSDCECVKQGD